MGVEKTPKKHKRCSDAIMALMSDYKPRTAEMMADESGYDLGKIRGKLRTEFMFEQERKPVKGGGVATWHKLKRHNLPPITRNENDGV
jgi:hypothetical protein